MRDPMERFVLLPFSLGCVSESSIAVAIQSRKQSTAVTSDPKSSSSSSSASAIRKREEDEESLSSNESMKSSSFRFLAISEPDISTGFHRRFKSFKTFSQLFVYQEEEEEIEETEKEIEIGFPTDVKHVTHIGIDGSSSSTTTSSNNIPINGWQDLMFPSVSLGQLDLAMASQQNHLLNKDSNN